MSDLKNIAIFGASGSLGAPILKALIASNKFNITVISRSESKATFPSSVKVIKTDYSSADSLTSALQGQDAVVSAVGNEGFLGQKAFIDAAIAVGVKHFIPSEFGSDLSHPKVSALAVFGHKLAIRQYLEEKVAAGANIAYTYVINYAFLDWGLQHSIVLDWKEGKPEIFDGGDALVNMTALDSVGQAVIGVLTHPEETKNRQVKVRDISISQNKLLELAKKVDPKRKWGPVAVNTKDIEKFAEESLAKGDYSMGVLFAQLKVCIFNEEYQSPTIDDNKLLGVVGKTDADVEAIWKGLLL